MRIARSLIAAALTGATAATLALSGTAPAASAQIGPQTSFTMTVHQDGSVVAPTDGDAVPNIDSVKSTLRAYYGATKGTDPAHAFDATAPATTYLPNLVDSAYAKNTKAVADAISAALPAAGGPGHAVVFDVDSTLLSDYSNEEDMNFNYNPTLNAVWVNNALMPAVPGMTALLQHLYLEGYTIYAVTGRPYAQESATLTNLTNDGYTTTAGGSTPLFTTANLYTKDDPAAGTIDCTLDGNPACSTVERKAQTRHHIETADGVTIDMNVGDQWSDLEGGYAAATQKVPNPSYFLPSADIPGAPATDSSMVLPTFYAMWPDGSAGALATDGDAIPNEGAVVSEIRAFYGASSGGVANPTTSPYISQLSSLESAWTPEIASACKTGAAAFANATTAQQTAAAALAKASRATAKAHRTLRRAQAAVKRAHGKAAKRAASSRTHLRVKLRRYRAAARLQAKAQGVVDAIHAPGRPAAVFDVDDTTLWNYDLEDSVMHFNYDPAVSATWVSGQKFPAVPGMPALVKAAAAAGCTIVGITGRPSDQQADTIANLTKAGYVDAAGQPLFAASSFYTKYIYSGHGLGLDTPSYLDCGDQFPERLQCPTIEYKSSTRRYLETQRGLDIVANIGDQFSDLHGGYADKIYKVPNPTYYLP